MLKEAVDFLRAIAREKEIIFGTSYRAPYLGPMQLIYELHAASLQDTLPALQCKSTVMLPCGGLQQCGPYGASLL